MTKNTHLSNIVQKVQTHAISEVKKFETNLLANSALNKNINPSYYFSNLASPIYDFHFAENSDSLFLSVKNKVLSWDIQTKKIIHECIMPHKVTNFATTSDGKTIATFDRDRDKLFILDIQTGKTIHQIKVNFEHNNLSKNVIISPDDQYALVTGDSTQLFNLQTGQPSHIFPTYTQKISLSRDSKFLTSTALDQIKLFDFHTGQLINRYPKPDPRHHVMLIDFDATNTSLIAHCYDTDYISFIDIRTGYIWKTLHFTPGSESFASSQVRFKVDQDNKNIYILTQDSIQMYDLESEKLITEVPGKLYNLRKSYRHNYISALNGNMFRTENKLMLWQMSDMSLQEVVSNSIAEEKFVAQSIDCKSFIFHNTHSVNSWQLETNQSTKLFQTESTIREVAYHQKSGQFLIAQANYENRDDTVIFTKKVGKESANYVIQTNFPTPMAFSSDAKYFSYYYVSLTRRGGWISIRSAENGSEIQDINIKFVPKLMCFSSDNSQFYTVVDHSFTVWDTMNGQILDQFRLGPYSNYDSNIEKIHIDQAGNTLIYCYYHSNLYIVFDLLTKRSLYRFSGSHLIFIPPDEKSFLSYDQGKITLREIRTGKILQEYPQQTGYDFISPNGKQAFALTDEQRINIYNPQNGELLGSTFHLNDGYLWTTPPDQFNNQGWLYTNRPDLISFAATNLNDPNDIEYLNENDERVKDYLAINNSKEMVMSRIFDPDQYRKLAHQRKNGELVITKALVDQRNQIMMRLLPNQTTPNNPKQQDYLDKG